MYTLQTSSISGRTLLSLFPLPVLLPLCLGLLSHTTLRKGYLPIAMTSHQSKFVDMLNLSLLTFSGRKVLDKPELKKVFRDRQIAGKKKEAEKWQESRRTSMEIKLMERQELLEKVRKEKILQIGFSWEKWFSQEHNIRTTLPRSASV